MKCRCRIPEIPMQWECMNGSFLESVSIDMPNFGITSSPYSSICTFVWIVVSLEEGERRQKSHKATTIA